MERARRSPEVDRLIQRFRENFIPCNLIRVGIGGDGAYLLPDVLNDISYCFSPGVGSSVDFEEMLSDLFAIKSFMADGSIQSLPREHPNFIFTRKFLGSSSGGNLITLTDWINESIGTSEEQLLLQMDIEGGEYNVLPFEDAATLARFSAMVIEFHYLDRIFDRDFARMINAIFDKIYRDFYICHVHPNNCCGVATFGGISVPRAMEVTFGRRDLTRDIANEDKIELPHSLDRKNIEALPDVEMPEVWWR